MVAVDKALLRTAEYVYKNAPYDHVCEMGRSVYGVTGACVVVALCLRGNGLNRTRWVCVPAADRAPQASNLSSS